MTSFFTCAFLIVVLLDVLDIPFREWIGSYIQNQRERRQLKELANCSTGKKLPPIPGEPAEKYRLRLIRARDKENRELEKLLSNDYLLPDKRN